ncbi:MAG: hypothetical protein ACRDF4_08155 [Rhabdochlamydiaceae bacterium]
MAQNLEPETNNYCNITVTIALGRTIPSARMLIELEITRVMHSYGKELSHSDKELLNNALQLSKKHVDAFGESVRLVPMQAILISILLEQERQLQFLLSQKER